MPTTSNPVVEEHRSRESADDRPLTEIVAACRVGSRDAQRELYERTHKKPFRLLVRMVGLDDASDLLQQVYCHVFGGLEQFRSQSEIATWLYRITINEALQHLRQRQRRYWSPLKVDVMDLEPNHEHRVDSKEVLDQALNRLDHELRSLFLLREVEQLSYAEIATTMQIPEGTVASRLNRARQLLMQYVIELGWEQ